MESQGGSQHLAKDELGAIVSAAIGGDAGAWKTLVDNFTPLVLAVMQRHRLEFNDAADANQNVWLALVRHLPKIREPAALPGWIVTCAKHEALRVLASKRRVRPVDPQDSPCLERADSESPDETVIRLERGRAVRAGIRELRPAHRQLLQLLVTEPDASYTDISRRLDMPLGSVGPTRLRSLNQLGRTPPVRRLAG